MMEWIMQKKDEKEETLDDFNDLMRMRHEEKFK